VIVHNRGRQEPGVDHLEDVLVFQLLVGRPEHEFRLPGFAPFGIDRLQVLPVTAGRPHPDFPAGEIVEAPDVRSGRAGDHDLLNAGHGRIGKIHQLLPFRGDSQVAQGQVAAALDQVLEQLVAANRDGHHVDLERPGAELLVEDLLEFPEHLRGYPALVAPVDEEIRFAVRNQRPDVPALDHAVQVAGPWPHDGGDGGILKVGRGGFGGGSRSLGRRCRRRLFTGPRRRPAASENQQHHEGSGAGALKEDGRRPPIVIFSSGMIICHDVYLD